MQRKRDSLVPVAEALADLPGPVKAIREAATDFTGAALALGPPQRAFTCSDQVNQLVSAREADADLGFMARTMALCSLPRTNPDNQLQYKRVNGPYKLAMISGTDNKLPYGNLPRLLLAWVCTEAVRTQSRMLILGDSVSEFMRKLDIYSTSGSPVVLKPVTGRHQNNAIVVGSTPAVLLGIVAETRYAPISAGEKIIPGFAGLGFAFDVETIVEVMDLF